MTTVSRIDGKTWQRPGRQHYTPDSVNERREMLRFVIYIAVMMMLVGLAGGIAS